MKILVCGDRNWSDYEKIKHRLSLFLTHEVTVIHGAARGADTLAGKAARELGFEVVVVPAQWKKWGRAAGPIRNREMLGMEPDLVLAFHNDLDRSRGTRDCVLEAQRRKIAIEVLGEKTGYGAYP